MDEIKFSLVLILIAVFCVASINAQSLGEWKLVGETGASAMHFVVTAPKRVVVLDKAELNPKALYEDGRTGWTTEYNLETNEFRMLNLDTNTFCSAGAFLANGTLVETAGGAANHRSKSGLASIRMFTGCQDETCDWLELPRKMVTPRWYNTMLTLPDGRVFIIGGSIKALAVNSKATNNPTWEIFPGDGVQHHLKFLDDTLPYNLYPATHVMPDRENIIWIFANQKSIFFDYIKGEVVKTLEDIPGHSRSYPLTGSSVMLPLTYENDYKPEVLLCGGSPRYKYTAQALNNCGRIDLSKKDPEWVMEDFGGFNRVMPDGIILPDGTVLFVNGAGQGYAGYDKKTRHVASKPVLHPVLYHPDKPYGRRWETLAPSEIPRMYHSVATLTADGTVFVAGSNPNNDYLNSTFTPFPTEYRAERFSPPYLFTNVPRPMITSLSGNKDINNAAPIPIKYDQLIDVGVNFNSAIKDDSKFTASIIHFGFVTHSQHMSQRYVKLEITKVKSDGNSHVLTIRSPPNSKVIAPGPSYVFVLYDGKPAETAAWVLLGL